MTYARHRQIVSAVVLCQVELWGRAAGIEFIMRVIALMYQLSHKACTTCSMVNPTWKSCPVLFSEWDYFSIENRITFHSQLGRGDPRPHSHAVRRNLRFASVNPRIALANPRAALTFTFVLLSVCVSICFVCCRCFLYLTRCRRCFLYFVRCRKCFLCVVVAGAFFICFIVAGAFFVWVVAAGAFCI